MTVLLFRLDENSLIVINTPDSAEKILDEVRSGRWMPPAPFGRWVDPAEPGTLPALNAVLLGSLVVITPQHPLADLAEDDLKYRVSLTDRQGQVLSLLLEGLNDKQIAARLKSKTRTVAYHIREIKSRLGASSRTELVRRATSLGYYNRKK